MTKYLFIAVLLLVTVSVGFSQGYTGKVAPKVLAFALNDSVGIAYYANSQSDTSVPYGLSGYSEAYFLMDADDSVSAVIKYLPSYDGVTFDDAAITMDSVSTQGDGASAANGIQYAVTIPKAVLSYPAVKFFVVFNGYGNGYSTPTYSAKLILK